MPPETIVKPDAKILFTAIAWALQFLIDPQRGASLNLPQDAELEKQFPKSNLTQDIIKNWLYNEFGETDLAKIAANQKKIQEVLEQIESSNKSASEGAIVPKIIPSPAPSPKVSTLGVLAELESIEPILKKHRQETVAKLSGDLNQKVRTILPSLGIKSTNEEEFLKTVAEIAQETAQEVTENVAQIQDPIQINQVIADSLTQSIIAHPQISNLKLKEEKLYAKIFEQTQSIAQTRQQNLEKAAILGQIEKAAKLQKPDSQTLNLVSDQIEQIVELESALTLPEERTFLKASLAAYLASYPQALNTKLAPILSQGNTPAFAEFQKIKESAHNAAIAQIALNLAKNPTAKKLETKISFKALTDHIGAFLGLKPLTEIQAQNFGLIPTKPKLFAFTRGASPTNAAVGLLLGSITAQTPGWSALVSYDKPRFDSTIENLSGRAKALREKRSQTYRDRKELLTIEKNLANFKQAKDLAGRHPQKVNPFLSYFKSRGPNRLTQASRTAWQTTTAYIGGIPAVFVPKSIRNNPAIMAGASFGALAPPGLRNFRITLPKLPSAFGIGKSLTTKTFGIAMLGAMAHAAGNIIAKTLKYGSAALIGLGLYFLGLAKAALLGFLIGAGVGGTAGAITGGILGAQVGAAIGTAVFPGVGTVIGGIIGGAVGTAVGFFIGAGVGGIVGGLIGYGLASGSTALVGSTTGTVIGALIGGIVIPIPVIGPLIGAAIGFFAGRLIAPFVKNAFDSIVSGSTTGVSAAGSAAGAFGSFVTGLGSAIWGGLGAGAGATLGFLSGAANFIVGGLGALSLPASAAAIPVIGGISAVAVGGTIVGLVTATSFFNPEGQTATEITPPGENQFFKVEKTASPTLLQNNQLPADLSFTITLTAKTKLTSIQISDQINVQAQTQDFQVTTDVTGKPIDKPCTNTQPAVLLQNDVWTCTFSIKATTFPSTIVFQDSLVTNKVTVTATPENNPLQTGTAFAIVAIGTPPSFCQNIELREENGAAWSDAEKNSIQSVCTELVKSTKIVNLLKNAGTIFLTKVPEGTLGGGVCGTVNGANIVKISCSMSSSSFAKYVIIHELGHIIGNFNGDVYRDFLNDPAYSTEGLMPTYPFPDGSQGESFAEMIADYVISKSYNFPKRSWSNYPGGPWENPGAGWTTFKQDRPLHYNFARDNIFGIEF